MARRRFLVVREPAEEGGYVVTVPALPGNPLPAHLRVEGDAPLPLARESTSPDR